jgi:hypothetical protein
MLPLWLIELDVYIILFMPMDPFSTAKFVDSPFSWFFAEAYADYETGYTMRLLENGTRLIVQRTGLPTLFFSG